MNQTAPTRRVRLRQAPSPTGDPHVGFARTVLFTWLFARQQGGDFILRIEDTDQKRLREESVESILDALHWLGLQWDEGPDIGGPYGPYVQSERLPLYQEHARWLVEHGHAYECFCSPERLEQVRAEQIANRQPPGYDRRCRTLSEEERAAFRAQGITPVIRLKVPLEGTTVVRDELRGTSSYENRLLEDAVLLKSDGFPTYHLAVVVDDHLMEISHVTRGEEWLPSFPLHALLYRAFGWEMPLFYHMPLILNPDGKGKLSKRHGAASVLMYRDLGYLPEALVNYLALLGWSYDDRTEIFSLEELIEKFDLDRVSPSPARYNFDKLLWFNQYYINHILDVDELTRRCIPFLIGEGEIDFEYAREAIGLVKDKMKVLTEAPQLTSFFFGDPDPYEADLLIPKKTEPALVLRALQRAREVIAETGVEDEAVLEERLRALADELGLKAGQLFMPIRVAVTGRTASPGLFATLRVIGLQRVLERLDEAINRLDAAWSPVGDESLDEMPPIP
jgi:glutamyl-tRNA synthetase